MAAAAIIGVAAPLIQIGVEKLFNWITHSAKGAEQTLTASGSGGAKFAAVANGTKDMATALSTAGEIPGVLTDEQIATIVQSVVSGMIASGQLSSSKTAPKAEAPAASVPVLAVGTKFRVAGILEVC